MTFGVTCYRCAKKLAQSMVKHEKMQDTILYNND